MSVALRNCAGSDEELLSTESRIRVLSIDVGVKSLSYSLLGAMPKSVRPHLFPTKKKKVSRGRKAKSGSGIAPDAQDPPSDFDPWTWFQLHKFGRIDCRLAPRSRSKDLSDYEDLFPMDFLEGDLDTEDEYEDPDSDADTCDAHPADSLSTSTVTDPLPNINKADLGQIIVWATAALNAERENMMGDRPEEIRQIVIEIQPPRFRINMRCLSAVIFGFFELLRESDPTRYRYTVEFVSAVHKGKICKQVREFMSRSASRNNLIPISISVRTPDPPYAPRFGTNTGPIVTSRTPEDGDSDEIVFLKEVMVPPSNKRKRKTPEASIAKQKSKSNGPRTADPAAKMSKGQRYRYNKKEASACCELLLNYRLCAIRRCAPITSDRAKEESTWTRYFLSLPAEHKFDVADSCIQGIHALTCLVESWTSTWDQTRKGPPQ